MDVWVWVARLFILLGALFVIILWRKFLLWLSTRFLSSFFPFQFAAAIIRGLFIIPLILFIAGYVVWGFGSFIVGLLRDLIQ